jgi:hypothetical protein
MLTRLLQDKHIPYNVISALERKDKHNPYRVSLKSARKNPSVMGIDGKHGLQDDGACLLTRVTQHKDGFGCPSAFVVMSRENTNTITIALRSILGNVPCSVPDCDPPP